MNRRVATAVMTAVLGSVVPLAGDAELYRLWKSPPYRAGDLAAVMQNYLAEDTLTLPDGSLFKSRKESRSCHSIHEVLEVDDAGRIHSFRVTIVLARRSVTTAGAKAPKETKNIALEQIHFIARRKDLRYAADLSTLVTEVPEKLTADQRTFLKEYCEGGLDYANCPQENIWQMPGTPVPAGHTWQLDPDALGPLTQGSFAARVMDFTPLGGDFRLASVSQGIAQVRGTLRAKGKLLATEVNVPTTVTARIDTETGRWLGVGTETVFTLDNPRVKAKFLTRDDSTITFTPGTGKVSAMARRLFNLGTTAAVTPKPTEPAEPVPPPVATTRPAGGVQEAGTYKDAAAGFSIKMPAGYTATEFAAGGTAVARFANKDGHSALVCRKDLQGNVDADDLSRAFLDGLREKMPDYEVSERQQFLLANDVPATLLVGMAKEAKLTILLLVVIDGSRVYNVTAGVPTGNKNDVAEMRKALRTFLVLEPKASKTEGEK